MEELFYLNGKLIPRRKAKVSVLDYGFLFGFGLYETIRAYNGKPFRLDSHIARMRYSADKLGILVKPQEIRQAVADTVKANGFNDTRIRITVSIGEGTVKPDLASCKEPTVAVLVTEYKPPAQGKYKNGFKVIVSSIRRNSLSPVTYMKSANTMESMLARRESRERGADEALFLNEKGVLTEASGSNIFLVKDGVLITPRFESGILPGVTRVVIFELANSLGIKVKEKNVRLDELLQADEAFITNSLIEVVPVTEVDGKKIGTGKPGPVTKRLAKAYKEMVTKETEEK
ncbi:MAG: aminotransferase class IV [Dehalococcoidales bacterium]|nr:aminotransferase class IV [Dehalococcoidales bacterium]